jgi:hypothetical protein
MGKTKETLKRFLIEVKEISYGVVEVFAENENEARELIESGDYDDFMVDDSEMILGNVVNVEDIDDEE